MATARAPVEPRTEVESDEVGLDGSLIIADPNDPANTVRGDDPSHTFGTYTFQVGWSPCAEGEGDPLPQAVLHANGNMEFINIRNEVRDKARLAAVIWDDQGPFADLTPDTYISIGWSNTDGPTIRLLGNRGVEFLNFVPDEEARVFWETVSCLRPWRLTENYVGYQRRMAERQEGPPEPIQWVGPRVEGPTWHERILDDEPV